MASDPGSEFPAAIGPYRIVGVLGEGGSAMVYAANFRGEDVALKVPRDRELSPREQQRFLEEAKMLARVRHRAVVEVLDSGRLPDGQPFLLMRRYEGETLADRLAQGGPLPLAHALDLFEQLASATISLHDAGLLHRDLKPENVLLTDGGKSVKLIDFGIAKDIDAPASTTTQAGVARGTPATMAPERFFGAPASKSTDVYELAVVFYAMLAGRLPWTEVTNPNSRLNPTSLTELGAPVPESLSNTVMRALSTRPERRPAGVRELLDEIQRAARAPINAGARVTSATSVAPPPMPMPSAKSEEAQVLESRREPRRANNGRLIAIGLGLLGAGALTVLVVLGLKNQAATAADLGGISATPAALAPAAPTAALNTAPHEPSAEALAPTPSPPPVDKPARSEAKARRPADKPPAREKTSKQPKAESSPPELKAGKPRGAPCTRSSECASMQCAAETCQ